MDQKTKIILGIALLGGAYYLYTRKKRESVGTVNTIQKPYMPRAVDDGYRIKNDYKAPRWRLKRDIINGVKPNSSGQPNILFKKGDIIQGNIETRFFFNKNNKGIGALPTVSGAYFEASPFVLLDDLEEVR